MTSCFPDSRAERLIAFIERHCRLPGRTEGARPVPFALDEWQKDFLRHLYSEDGERNLTYTRGLLSVSKKNGKDLSLDTPVPTVDGWKTVGTLKVGDRVFTPDGEPTRVRQLHPVYLDKPCVQIEWMDGEKIVCSADHGWPVRDVGERKNIVREVRADNLRSAREDGRGYFRAEHYSRVPKALRYLGADDLPVPPYTLGAWLGDGNSTSGFLTCDDDDIWNRIAADGFRIGRRQNGRCRGHTILGLKSGLRKIGVLGDKHVPEIYLHAAVQDRMEILRGLMDTDGTIKDGKGQAELTLSRERLIDGAERLIQGLGWKTQVRPKPARLNGRDMGIRYTLSFSPTWAWNPFHLRRKSDRVRDNLHGTKTRVAGIRSVTIHKPVPVRCITVADEGHQFLVGWRLKPTCNTGMMSALMLAYLAGPLNRPSGRYYSVAGGSQAQAGELFHAVADMVARNPKLESRLEVHRAKNSLVITHREQLSSYKALTTNANAIHGIIPDFWVYDEIAQAKDFSVYEALDRAQGTKKNSMGIIISTMSQTPHNPMATIVKSVQEGQANGIMKHWYSRVYQADPEGDLYDFENVAKANPSMGSFLSEESVRREIEEAQAMSSRRFGYMAYRLNLDAGVESSLLNVLDWARCGTEINREELKGKKCYLGLDLSGSRDLTALAAYFPEEKTLICDAWLPKMAVAQREQEDHAPYREWVADGWLNLCEGEVINKEDVLVRLLEWCSDFDVLEIRYDAWRIPEMEADAIRNGWPLPEMTAFRQGFITFGPAIDELERLVVSGELKHEDNPVLNMCIRNTRAYVDAKATNGERKPVKVLEDSRIDCAVAAIMAVSLPKEPELPPRTADDLILRELYQ